METAATFSAFRAKVVLNELTHFAAALVISANTHTSAEQPLMMLDKGVLYTTASRENTMRCLAAGKHPVEHAQAQRNRPVDDLAEHGVRGSA